MREDTTVTSGTFVGPSHLLLGRLRSPRRAAVLPVLCAEWVGNQEKSTFLTLRATLVTETVCRCTARAAAVFGALSGQQLQKGLCCVCCSLQRWRCPEHCLSPMMKYCVCAVVFWP